VEGGVDEGLSRSDHSREGGSFFLTHRRGGVNAGEDPGHNWNAAFRASKNKKEPWTREGLKERRRKNCQGNKTPHNPGVLGAGRDRTKREIQGRKLGGEKKKLRG